MLVLLSPSKTQNFDDPIPVAAFSQPRLLEESAMLIKQLSALSISEISALMQVSEKIATLNHARYHTFSTPFTEQNARPAVFAFRGDVYDGLNAPSFNVQSLEFAQAHLRIVSGLYGLLRPLDLIQPYRLEMKTKLKNSRGKDLYAFWGNRVTELIKEDLAGMRNPAIINLASQEYANAVNFKALNVPVITPQFKEKQASGYKIIGLLAKKARGRMAHYICSQHIDNEEAIRFFSEDGYRLNVSLSTPLMPVYTRSSKKSAIAKSGQSRPPA